MRIVQVIDAVLPVRKYGGTERVVQSLGRALVEAGHEVTLLAREGTQSRSAQVIVHDRTKPLDEQLPEVPLLAYRVLKDAAEGNLEIKWQSDELVKLQKQVKANHRQTLTAISGGSLLISGSILFAATSATMPTVIAAGAGSIGLLLLASLLKK